MSDIIAVLGLPLVNAAETICRETGSAPAFTAFECQGRAGLRVAVTATMVARVLREGILGNYNWDRAPTVWERNRKMLSISTIFILAAAAAFLLFG